jgi:hypothetical protein
VQADRPRLAQAGRQVRDLQRRRVGREDRRGRQVRQQLGEQRALLREVLDDRLDDEIAARGGELVGRDGQARERGLGRGRVELSPPVAFTRTVGSPARAQTSAIPVPMSPAPMTPTHSIDMAGSLRGGLTSSTLLGSKFCVNETINWNR